MAQPLSVFVIIVNYNSASYLPSCLEFLKKQTFKNFPLVIVDNASPDESYRLAARFFPKVKLILNSRNLGFPAAANQGIKYALKKGADYLVLLGFDTRPEKNWLEELIKAANNFPQTGIFQSKMLLLPQKEKINSLGNKIHFLGFGFCSHYLEKDSLAFSQPKEIAYASGTAMLVKKSVLEKIGFLDEKLMFLEDLDFGWRARLFGFKIRLAPLSRIYHHYEFNRYPQKYYFLERGRLLVLLKNYQLKTLLLLTPALLLTEIVVSLCALLAGWLPDKIKAFIYAGQNLTYALKERAKVQKLRKISDWKMRRYFTAKITAPVLPRHGRRAKDADRY